MLALALVVVLGIIMFPMEAKSQMGPGMMGRGYGQQQQGGWNYCLYCGTPQGPGSLADKIAVDKYTGWMRSIN